MILVDIETYLQWYYMMEPTFNTNAPTSFPTNSPKTDTLEPTTGPTNSPTDLQKTDTLAPSNSPTFEPKIHPTNSSEIVTDSPSIHPSIYPTIEPTELNSTTSSPTIKTKTQLNNNPSKIPTFWIIIITVLVALICCVMLFLFIYTLTKQIYLENKNTIKNQSELASMGYNSNIDDNDISNYAKINYNNSNNDDNNVIKQIKQTNKGNTNSDDKIPAPFENEYDDETEIIVEGTEIVYQAGATNQPQSKGKKQMEGPDETREIKETKL